MRQKFLKQAKQIIDVVEKTQDSIFITGKAGTGKSTLLEHIRLYSKKKIVVLAPTGISAINVNGETIHSFFTLKPGFELEEARKIKFDVKKRAKFRRLKTLAIDEISMVRADLLDAVDIVLKRAKKNDQPFGGVQMIFFGDLYQLPPVVTSVDREKFYSEYPSPYFFDAEVFRKKTQHSLFEKGFDLKTFELTKIYRQKDDKFIEILNAVRDAQVSEDHLKVLNQRYQPNFKPKQQEKYVYLMTTNVAANNINFMELKKLNQQQIIFESEKFGTIARNLYPNDEQITLCEGAQVMFICNDPERRWVNGTIGKVLEIAEFVSESGKRQKSIFVEKADGGIVEVRKHTWEISKYILKKNEFTRDIIGSYTQIPLKLAWAITIHKSQGKTFDKVIIDLGKGTFVHGQTYVALSRCTSLKGLVLKKIFYRSSIIMDKRVRNFNK